MLTRFVSYAQNFEDVMLWRALKNYPPGQYVDVGAHDPVHCSVTKAFYERGWRGINVDAVPELVERLKKDRPEDTNHALFIGADDGYVEFFQIGDSGISTYREDYAERHRKAGFECSKIHVEVRTLTSVLQKSLITNDSFHFLKIDVEGAEADVLLGMDFERFRPWIVVVEATEPNSMAPSLDFEPLLLAKRYLYVYFDGLNRFYVAEEKPDLFQSFQFPPCVFDDFDMWELVHAKEAIVAAESYRVSAVEDFQRQLASQVQLIESRDSIIRSKDATIVCKNELIEAKDQLLGEKESTIVSKDATIFYKHQLVESKDSIIRNRDSNIAAKDSIIASRDAHIHSLHLALNHFMHRASHIHSTFTAQVRLTGKGLSSAYQVLYASALWRRGAWIARLFRSKSPRSRLSKASAAIKDSNARFAHDLIVFRDEISRTVENSAPHQIVSRRLGKSAAALFDLINTGPPSNFLK